jgi:hypothetical protein
MPLAVDQQSPEVLEMARHWPIADALLGGTSAMRAVGELYLPKEKREDPLDWEYRLKVATLFPAFRRTISVMAGKPFAKQLTYGEDVPQDIKAWCDNCDLEGASLHVFSSRLMHEALAYGLSGVVVDHPTRALGEPNTLATDRAQGYRPYLTHIRHDRILGWDFEKVGGNVRLTQLRYLDPQRRPDGPFGSAIVPRVRVLYPGRWEVYEKAEDGSYTLAEGGTTSLNYVPFVPFYGERTGFMTGKSPLLDLASLNVKHWQQQSDQDDSARFARKRLLVLSGIDDDTVTLGSATALRLPPGASAQIVQGSAESVNVGRSELEALEAQMIQTGAELLIQREGQRTATEANNDAEANKSDLQRIVEGFEDSVDQVLQMMSDWVRLGGQGGHVALFKDFSAATLTDASAQLVLSMQQSGLITKQTAIREQQRRGMLSPDLNPDKELEAVGEEGPALGTLGLNGGGGE